MSCSLSPNTFSVLGERVRVRGPDCAHSRKLCLVPRNTQRLTKRETRHSVTDGPSPYLPPNRPKTGDSGGEEKNWSERSPRAARGPPALACLGYLLPPLQGSLDEAAASLPLYFLKNVQSPDSSFRGNDGQRTHIIRNSSFPRKRESSVGWNSAAFPCTPAHPSRMSVALLSTQCSTHKECLCLRLV